MWKSPKTCRDVINDIEFNPAHVGAERHELSLV